MKRWHMKRDQDDYDRVTKIRKKKGRTPPANELEEPFEKDEGSWDLTGTNEAFAARVVEVHKKYAFVSREPVIGEVDTKDVWLATIARKYMIADRVERNLVAVGDRVLVTPAKAKDVGVQTDIPQCVIQHMTPRLTKIARLDPHTPTRLHVLASNMTQVMIVASYVSPSVKWGLIDRYLVLAEMERVRSLIILNKSDLLKDESEEYQQECAEREAIYRGLGYEVLKVQANAAKAKKDPTIMHLKELLNGQVTLLSGHSGVGKSSLVNLYKPEIIQAVEPDDNIFYKGRHTTSFASLIKLGSGGYVIDTPGIRSFTFDDLGPIALSDAFVEFRPLIGKCKYRECSHREEPDCVIKDAVEAGTISRWRYKSYLGILLGATGREGRVRDLPIDEQGEDEDS